MEISIERRAEVPGEKDLKFRITVTAIDGHTHGEMTRADKQAVSGALALAADGVEAVLKGR